MSPRKAKAEPPFFPFYAERWLQSPDVRAMTPAARGAFVDLLCFQFVRGSLPVQPATLAALCGLRGRAWAVVWTQLEPHFPCVGDARQNPSLASKIADHTAARTRLSDVCAYKGRKSAARRKSLQDNNRRGTAVEPRLNRGSTGGQPEGNIPTTHVMGSSSQYPARATPPVRLVPPAPVPPPPPPAADAATDVGARFRAKMAEIEAEMLAPHLIRIGEPAA